IDFDGDAIDRLGLDDGFYTVREITDRIIGGASNRSQRDRVKDLVIRRVEADRIQPAGTATHPGYPVDESLILIAERIEAFAGTASSGRSAEPLEQLLDTATMSESVRLTSADTGANFAVRVS